MKPYILLTPGPLTTSETVKEAMLTDWCTWDADYNVHIVEEIRKSLVALATKQTDEYTSVLLQGSGTYCVEAVIGSTVKPGDKLLILSNGAYGDRMGNIAEYHGIRYTGRNDAYPASTIAGFFIGGIGKERDFIVCIVWPVFFGTVGPFTCTAV